MASIMTGDIDRSIVSDDSSPRLRRPMLAFLVILALWAGIYLPGLGVLELKGEEATRIWPAMNMLDHGQWALPHIAGEAYFNKPPLINWLIAGSFAITGERSEAAARAVGAVMTLLFACHLLFTRCAYLSGRARFIAALMFMTMAVMVEKGRLTEMEGPYICLTGMSVLWWLSGHSRGKRWSTWVGAGVLIGLGLLTKPPVNVGIFYVTVICVLAYERRLRELFSLPSLACLLIAAAMMGGWVLAAQMQATDAERKAMFATWFEQTAMRMSPEHGDEGWLTFVKGWLVNIGGSSGRLVLYMMPWALFLPALVYRSVVRTIDDSNRPAFKGLRLASLMTVVLMLLAIPGGRARYLAPMLPVAVIVLAWALSIYRLKPAESLIWRGIVFALLIVLMMTATVGMIHFERWVLGGLVALAATVLVMCVQRSIRVYRDTPHQATLQGAGIALAMLLFALYAPELAGPYSKRREIGRMITASVPESATLYCPRGMRPSFLFYIDRPIEYVDEADLLREPAEYILILHQAFKAYRGDPEFAEKHDVRLRRLETDDVLRHRERNYQVVHIRR
jgi:4-amino-4-deoxy-L-arabinose transferase-like glycosyltransferase